MEGCESCVSLTLSSFLNASLKKSFDSIQARMH